VKPAERRSHLRNPGLVGVYVGPSDLGLAVGGASPSDPSVDEPFEAAIVRVQEADLGN
jgi:4-hydroxy-2-oxoheptanedioate aldolase